MTIFRLAGALLSEGAMTSDPEAKEVIIVTGSSGTIGSAFINHVGENFLEMGFDRAGPPFPPPNTDQPIDCDVTSDESVAHAMEAVKRQGHTRIASVVHLAAYYDFSGEPSPLYEKVTIEGTRRLLRALRDFEVEQFVFSSTMLVHAPCKPGERISERSPVEPSWDYPNSKIRTEQLIEAERGDIPVVLLRIAGIYDDRCHSIPLSHQIKRIREKAITSRVFPGDLSAGQAYLHLEDMVEALEIIVRRRRELPAVTTLLLGEEEVMGYDELQREIARLLHGEDWETQKIPKILAKSGAHLQEAAPGMEPFIKPWMIDHADDHYALDISRARELLDWSPRRSLRETLPKMIESLKADPAAWYRENKLKS